MRKSRQIPFAIDRTSSLSLEDQVSEGFRQAIMTGYYREGDVLPTVEQCCRELGVSIRSPVAALKRLAEEGLVKSRKRLGSMVLGPAEKAWKGHVIIIHPDTNPIYWKTAIEFRLSENLVRAGYLVTPLIITGTDDVGYDFSTLPVVLNRSVSLVVLLGATSRVMAELAKCRVPFVSVGGGLVGDVVRAKPPANCIGEIGFDISGAVAALNECCRARNVGRMTLVVRNERPKADVHSILPDVPEVGYFPIPAAKGFRPGFDGIITAARDAFLARYAKRGSAKLPEAFLFTDDYRARGAMIAFYELGLKVPEDVQVVTVAHRGAGPVAGRTITRLEFDPYTSADNIAESLVTYLSTGSLPAGLKISAQFIPGETF